MPAAAPTLGEEQIRRAKQLGEQLRNQRRYLQISATVAAEAAGMSRVTWYRIEKGSTSVTFGAYLAAAHVLGLHLQLTEHISSSGKGDDTRSDEWIPARISLASYPQLASLAWQVHGVDTLTPIEAFDIYERNGRRLEQSELTVHEKKLIRALDIAFRKDPGHVSS